MKLRDYQNNNLNHMDLGTPPDPGGEIFGSQIKKFVQNSNFMENIGP
jgi:hypothetical protein